MFRTALRNVLAHKARLLMTVLAVMLGVAFVSGTLVFTDTLGNALRNQSAKSYDDVAVSVQTYADQRDQEKTGIDAATLEKIQGIDGVAAAHGRVSGFAGVADPDGKLIGSGWSNTGANFAPGADGKDPQYVFTDGKGPKAGQVALDRATADQGEYQVGDKVRVATNGPVQELTLSGVFTTEDGAVNAGGSLVLFDQRTAQKQYLRPGYFKDVTVTAASGASDTALLEKVEALLPEDATAQTGQALAEEQAKDIESGLTGLNTMLLAFAGIALFVGVFLIANTFTMLIAQRTRELALMRAVGASRRQVKRSVLAEAALVGLVASAVGFGLGLGLAVALRSAMDAFGAEMPAGPLVVSPVAVGSAFGVGVVITVLAAWLPARRAAKIPPVAAMNSVHAVATVKSLVVRNTIGSIVTAAGAVAIVAGASKGGGEGRYLIAGGAFFALLGVMVLIPLLSRPVIAAVRPLLTKVFGVSGKLAAQNAVRNPRRTGTTASALAIGLTLVTGLSVLGLTVGQAIDRMTTDHIRADYMVTMASGRPMDSSALKALEGADGVSAVSPKQAAGFQFEDDYLGASSVTPGAVDKVFHLKVVDGSLATLEDGAIAVDTKTADKRGWKVGDTLPVTFDDEKKGELKVGATFEGNEFLDSVLIDRAVADAHEAAPMIMEIWVNTDGGPSDSARQALVDALGNNPAIDVMDQQEIRNAFGGMINTMLYIMYGLLAMALIIAVLGVVNTLAMSVFERQQEIGMLRAIGLDRRRVKRMIRLEAVVISLFGAVLGTALGVFLGWAIGETIAESVPGYELVLPWDRIAIFLALAGLVGVLAALWPARSAARLNVLTAIKTE
ncbi:ABC transporter [Streptomyces albidoflavus]|uniref:ABC transporter permease n=1 Tax=Streptomyces albidoflavus TaxID=1886 RepID=UPI00102068A9|nr:ABC transporter permease [Streptomyces albidoflavus]RZD69356.1 ABC transporter [Streptomyces albidoflavus]